MRTLVIAGCLLLTACGDDRPPAPTPEEATELNRTEDMLNELAKEEGPEANAPDPSNSTN